MEFCLIKDSGIQFENWWQYGFQKATIKCHLSSCSEGGENNSYAQRLNDYIVKNGSCWITDGNLSWNLEVRLSFLDHVATIALKPDTKESVFARLRKAFGVENLKFILRVLIVVDSSINLSSEITDLQMVVTPECVGFEHQFKTPQAISCRSNMVCALNVSLGLSDKAINMLHYSSMEESLRINRKILSDSVGADTIIIAANGSHIKCHKSFLSAHSSVFDRMFETQMREGLTSTVVMQDISEVGVCALLQYIYYWDLTAGLQSSEIALELYKAADKYSIPELQLAITDIILCKQDEWLSIDTALELHFLLKLKMSKEAYLGYEYESSLEQKVAKVIKSKSFQELQSCSEYKRIFKEDPATAEELCTYFIMKT